MVGLGMAGFIVMDMVGAGSRAGNNQFTIGQVNGEKIDWNQFQRAERILYPNSSEDIYAQRNYLWNYLLEERILKQEAEDLGLSVGEEEMQELQFGQRLSPVIQRNFRDPNTGQMDRNTLEQIKANLGTGRLQPELEQFWAFQKEEIVKDRLQTKIAHLVRKSVYTPTWMAQQLQVEQGSAIDFLYVQVPFEEVNDSEVELTDEDYKNWMAENAGLIKRKEEFRTVDFLVLDVIPTGADTQLVVDKISEKIEAFRTTDNDSLFVENNFGLIDEVYFTKDDFSETIADTVFDLPVGTVYGPYLDENTYRAVKILGKKTIPDSVKSRHILIQAKTMDEMVSATRTIDSLKTVIEAGVQPFDSLARMFGQDGSAASGGDLGWSGAGRMVKEFNDLIFYKAEPGELHTVVTQFGVHLVEVTGRKYETNETGVKVAYLVEPIVPSEATESDKYDEALEYVGQYRTLDELKTAVEAKPEYSLETVQGLTQNAYQFGTLGSSGTSRDIVRWAFDPETRVGQVAPEVFVYSEPTLFYDARYVISALRSIVKPGVANLAEVKETFQQQVLQKKKGEILASRITTTDLDAVASQYGAEIDTILNANFNMSYLQQLGNETRLIGVVTELAEGESAGPVIGANGVYVVKVIARTEASLSTDISSYRRQISSLNRSNVDSRLLEAMKDAAEVKDLRFNFY